MSLELNKALEGMTRQQLNEIVIMVKEMREDYMVNKSKLVSLGYSVKPFRELVEEELIAKLNK